MKKSAISLLFLGALFSASAAVQAADNLSFKGTLIIPNCTINNNKTIEVDWKNVEIQSFEQKNTGYHEKAVKIPLECPYYWKTPKVKLTSAGMHTVSGEQGIKTSKYSEGLLVYLKSGKTGKWMNTVNTFYDIPSDSITGSDTKKTLTLYAYLGRYKEITDLTPGGWDASAGMEVRYD
ncbi:fimbrial protein [Escherichia coli]|nr:fimbrial protein [Escherichia coli]